jgi:ubiquinone/menaquinone biosynthesis C-methylase UbiE
MTVAEQAGVLCCPDDRADLMARAGHLACSRCGRQFPVWHERVIELLPSIAPQVLGRPDITSGYGDAYIRSLSQPLDLDTPAHGWQLSDSRGHRVLVQEHLRLVRDAVGKRPRVCLADVSAGAGLLTFSLRPLARVVLHCDLDPASIAAGWQRAQREQAENLLFVRSDYLRLPFRTRAIDAVLATDTLIRGPSHERGLLSEIHRVLAPGGLAVVDFKAVRPVYRKDARLQHYRPREIRDLLKAAGFRRWKLQRFGCLPTRMLFCRHLFRAQAPLAWALGPVRYLAVLEGAPREAGAP